MCTNMGGRGGSSGLGSSKIPSIKSLDIQKNDLQGISFDANKLKGSPAQIKFAQDIVDRGYSYIDNEIKNYMDSIEGMYAYHKDNVGKAYQSIADAAAGIKAFVEAKKGLKRSLEKSETASGIIKNRSMIENGFPSARNKAKEQYMKEYIEKYKKIFKQ